MSEVDAHLGDIAFEGTFAQVQEHFLAKGWSDGLPVVPPTAEAVGAFLAFTDLAADDTLGMIRPSRAQVTLTSVAVNGVMAGCRPEYMPILVAIARILVDPEFWTKDAGATPGMEPIVVVSGPLIEALEFNYLQGVLRIGRQANASIGRFTRLFMRNVAELRIPPGNTDKGAIGMNFHVALPENEAAVRALGWPTFGDEHGCPPGANLVTILGLLCSTAPIYTAGEDPKVHLDKIALFLGDLSASWVGVSLLFPGHWHPLLVLSPQTARILAAGGYDKPAIRRYLHEKVWISPRKLVDYWATGERGPDVFVPEPNFSGANREALAAAFPGLQEALSADVLSEEATVPVFPWPEQIEIVLAGEPRYHQSRGYLTNHRFGTPVSQVVELPQRWDELFADALTRWAALA